jgi:transposase
MCSDHTCEYRPQVHELESQVAQQATKIAELEAELAKYKKPPKNSSNSSLPPSQDPNRARYSKKEKSERPSGGQTGHKGHYHPFTEEPDIVKPLYPSACPYCGCKDILPQAEYQQTCQEINLPKIRPVVTEYRQHVGLCQHCGKKSAGEFPSHMKAPVQMGESISGLIGYLKQVQHMSHKRIVQFFKDVFCWAISEGFVNNRLEKLAEQHQQTYDAIGKALPLQSTLGSDETSQTVEQKKVQLWVFQNQDICYFMGNRSRGFDEIKALFGTQFEGNYVSDRLGSHLKLEAKHQLCIVHLIRNFQYAIDVEHSPWAKEVQQFFREVIHYRKQQGEAFDPVNNQDVFLQCEAYRQRLQTLFEKPPPLEEKEARTLFHSLVGRQEQILLFLRDPEVPHDNNASERALRPAVVHRKVLGGFHSDKGSHCQDVFLTLIETAKRQNQNILDVLSGHVTLNLPFLNQSA